MALEKKRPSLSLSLSPFSPPWIINKASAELYHKCYTRTHWIFTRAAFARDKRERGRRGSRKEEEKGQEKEGENWRRWFILEEAPGLLLTPLEPILRDKCRPRRQFLQVWPLIRQNCGKYETNHHHQGVRLSRPRVCQLLSFPCRAREPLCD